MTNIDKLQLLDLTAATSCPQTFNTLITNMILTL